MTSPMPWQSWAPPLDPPTTGGLPVDAATAIADEWWSADPHMCAALQWESYAAMLPPAAAVSQVSTGAQNVSYSPAAPPGAYGAALARAAWHRSFVTGELVSVPLHATTPRRFGYGEPWNWWESEPWP
jgi:hypothetical protein